MTFHKTFTRFCLLASSFMGLGVAVSGIALAAPLAQTPTNDAYMATPGTTIVPTPKEANFPTGLLPLEKLCVQSNTETKEYAWALRDLQNEWRVRLGKTLAACSDGGVPIRVGAQDNAAFAKELTARNIKLEQNESYALWVDATGATVVGADALAAYRGVQTLRQLLTNEGLRFAQVRDWPDLAFRGAMVYLDKDASVNNILVPLLARLKFNQVLVMSNYVQWNASRNVWHPNGATREQAIKTVQLIRDHGMEPIPLIETPGHAQWMFYNPQSGKFDNQKELWQDPEAQTPYAYDTLNPKTYEFLLPIFTEAVELFKPKYVHIGHDESRSVNRFPARENGIALGFEKLFVDDTIKLYSHLKSLGVGTVIWDDMAFGEAYRDTVAPMLPKDIVVMSWKYENMLEYPALTKIKNLGFQVVGASWFQNPTSFAKFAAQQNAHGMMQTRWSGYFGNLTLGDGQAEQGVAYVTAGAQFWNAQATPPQDATARYRDAWKPGNLTPLRGTTIDLSSLVTRKLSDNDETQWIQKGPGIDLSGVPLGISRFGALKFDVSGAVMLRGSRAAASELPEKIVVPLGCKAAAVAFLHTTGWLTSPYRNRIGTYTLRYSDGTSSVIPLEYGRNITGWTDTLVKSVHYAAAWRGQTRDKLEVGLGSVLVANPKPETVIESLEFASDGKEANPALLGLTLLEGLPQEAK